eukprot:CAMPEP_0176050738 /NCGR_PEP_ID=MMETSP0120_2-20121206/25220_1 /TAXON_ID=160619 /ORGANISM="Kryptoperidinium foliaceum, Strain CCMP 1326" /LENGTH=227 /DNA_ID=CAMNT_0017384173 /DNA_START=66 /DNA_END=745 /DNA_ORIENTATION=-
MQSQKGAFHMAALLAEMPVDFAAMAIQEAARQQPVLKQIVLDAWNAEDCAITSMSDFLTVGGLAKGCDDPDERTPGGASAEAESASAATTADTEGQAESETNASTTNAGDDSVARRRTLCFAYFPRSATEEDLAIVFSEVPPASKSGGKSRRQVNNICLSRDSAGKSLCYGFVEFAEVADAEAVLKDCRDGRIMLDDEFGHTWHLRASQARRRTAAEPTAAGGPNRR